MDYEEVLFDISGLFGSGWECKSCGLYGYLRGRVWEITVFIK